MKQAIAIILKKEGGFTLIELVIVIVLVGILSSTVLPKLANLTTQARTTANRQVAGTFRSAIGIAHSAWFAAGAVTGGTTIKLETTSVTFSSQGWPNGGAAAGAAASTAAQCLAVWNQILNNPPQAQTAVASCKGTGPCYVVTAPGGVCTYSFFSGGPTGKAVSPTTNITYSNGTIKYTP